MIGVKKLQDFSKAMIGPVLYLPAIGLLIALFSMTTNRLWVDESSGLYLMGKFVSSMLWALMNHRVSVLPWAGQRSGENPQGRSGLRGGHDLADVPGGE